MISDISPVCFWQKDFYQEEHIDDSGGPNLFSLREAIDNFKTFGAPEVRFVNFVRSPQKDEIKEWSAVAAKTGVNSAVHLQSRIPFSFRHR